MSIELIFSSQLYPFAYFDLTYSLQNHDKWKYPVNNKVGTPPNNSMSYIGSSSAMSGVYDLGQNKSIPSEHLVYMSTQILGGMHMHPQYLQQSLNQQMQMQMRQGQVSDFSSDKL